MHLDFKISSHSFIYSFMTVMNWENDYNKFPVLLFWIFDKLCKLQTLTFFQIKFNFIYLLKSKIYRHLLNYFLDIIFSAFSLTSNNRLGHSHRLLKPWPCPYEIILSFLFSKSSWARVAAFRLCCWHFSHAVATLAMHLGVGNWENNKALVFLAKDKQDYELNLHL